MTVSRRPMGILILLGPALGLVLSLLLSVTPAVLSRESASAATDCRHSTPAPRGTVNTKATSNPLDDHPWAGGVVPSEGAWQAYCASTGTQRQLLAKIALQPRMMWFGHWYSTSSTENAIRTYIRAAQQGNPNVMVHLSVFRLWPRQEAARYSPLTRAEIIDYRRWVGAAARGIGSANVAMVLEPDLGIAAYDSAKPGVRLALAKYAAAAFSKLPHTAVYLDASSSDWLRPDKAALMLQRAGVAYVRGFALGATHYAPLGAEIDYGTKVVGALNRLGLRGKHYLVDTADNARGFTFQWYQEYRRTHPGADVFDNARTCTTWAEHGCVTLGIPPTWHVASSRWHLTAMQHKGAALYADGFTWFGRPWLYKQASPFLLGRSLTIARSTPWQS